MWDSGKITKDATCKEPGSKTYTCTRCRKTSTEEIPATGHQYTELRNEIEANCIQEGYTGDVYCTDCGIKISSGKTIPKEPHTWDEGKVTKNATCTEKEIRTFTCEVCRSTRIEEIHATGHVNTITKFSKKASCKSDGYSGDIFCQDCGKLLKEGTIIPKTKHTWNAGKITTAATTTKEGIKTFTCTFCGVTRTEKIAKLKPQTVTPGKVINDKATNGVYKVLKDGMSVEFTKPFYKKASVRIPDTVKINGITCKVTGISANAFKNNTVLKTVTIGKNVTVIGTDVFWGCRKLNKVSGGNNIMKIGDRAFANCVSLSSITISETVSRIGKQAFYNCKNLRTVIIKTGVLSNKTIGEKAFAGTYKKLTVKVPAKQLNAYKKLLKSRGMSSTAVYKNKENGNVGKN